MLLLLHTAQAQELSFPVTIQVSEELADKIEKGQAQEFLQENGILELRRVFPHAGVFTDRKGDRLLPPVLPLYPTRSPCVTI